MGLESKCTLRVAGKIIPGSAHLDAEKLLFRGAERLAIELPSVKSVALGKGGDLLVNHAGGVARIEFGDRATAEKWLLKIRHPRSLIDKLGVKPGSRVVVIGVADANFFRDLRERCSCEPEPKPTAGLDFIFFAADGDAELEKLKTLRRFLQPAGAIWVVSLKGREARIKDTDVMRAARAAGLVDNKVCSFSATHTALKLVIPVAAR